MLVWDPHGGVAALGEMAGFGEAGEPRTLVPAQVGGDESTLSRLLDAAQTALGPALIGREVTVARRQDAMGDEQFSQVLVAHWT